MTDSSSSSESEVSVFSDKICREAVLELLVHLISEPAFDKLRTQEQLGYIVHTAVTKVR